MPNFIYFTFPTYADGGKLTAQRPQIAKGTETTWEVTKDQCLAAGFNAEKLDNLENEALMYDRQSCKNLRNQVWSKIEPEGTQRSW